MKILYLDQNQWDRLEKVHFGIKQEPVISNLLILIQKLIHQKKLRIVIDINRLIETTQRRYEESRRQISNLMLELSQGYYVLPCFYLEEDEIRNYFFRKMGLEETNILNLAISNDISHLLVGTPKIEGNPKEQKEIEKMNEKIKEYISRPEFPHEQFNKFLEKDKLSRQNYIKNAENARQVLYEMENEDQRKKYQLELNFKLLINEIKKLFYLTEDAPKSISDDLKKGYLFMIQKYIPKEFPKIKDKTEFIRQFPLFHTHSTLIDASFRDLRRKIKEGDNIDAISYVVPIAYFNYLVGEKYFINLAKQEKLDEIYGCILLEKLEELEPHLNTLLLNS